MKSSELYYANPQNTVYRELYESMLIFASYDQNYAYLIKRESEKFSKSSIDDNALKTIFKNIIINEPDPCANAGYNGNAP